MSGLTHEQAEKLMDEWQTLSQTSQVRLGMHLEACDQCRKRAAQMKIGMNQN